MKRVTKASGVKFMKYHSPNLLSRSLWTSVLIAPQSSALNRRVPSGSWLPPTPKRSTAAQSSRCISEFSKRKDVGNALIKLSALRVTSAMNNTLKKNRGRSRDCADKDALRVRVPALQTQRV